MAGNQNFNTYTEVDSASDITRAENSITWDTMRRDADSYVYYDFGADYFGDFEIQFTLDFSQLESLDTSNREWCLFGVLSNAVGNYAEMTGTDLIAILPVQNAALDDEFDFRCYQRTGGVEDWNTTDTTNRGLDPYYLTWKRVGATVTLQIYSDSTRETLLDTITEVAADQTAYRYFMPLVSYNPAGGDPGDYSSAVISDCNIMTPLPWLEGWSKRTKLTLDQNDITSTLSNFPVLIYLSSSSGRNSDNVTFVFDEVGANSLKIAVTTSNATTECYVEIEKWDSGSEQAWIWAKIPSIASGADTDIYLYYDNAHANNTTYVGATNSAAAESVWDTDFIAVYHMKDGVDNQNIYDSTSFDRDGVKGEAGNPSETTGELGQPAQSFDNIDSRIDIGAHTGPYTNVTAESIWKCNGTSGVLSPLFFTEEDDSFDRIMQNIDNSLWSPSSFHQRTAAIYLRGALRQFLRKQLFQILK